MGHIRADAISAELPAGQRLMTLLADAGIRADLLRAQEAPLPRTQAFGAALLVLEAGPDVAATAAALRRLRASHQAACLVLGPRLPPEAAAELLDAGADEVLEGTASSRLALARVRAVLRRTAWGGPAAMAAPPAWVLVPARRLLCRPDGRDAELTTAEYDLFALLAEQQGRIICRDTVAQRVLRRRIAATDRSVDNLVMRLRRKLGHEGAVKTVRGQGYMFAGFDDAPLRFG